MIFKHVNLWGRLWCSVLGVRWERMGLVVLRRQRRLRLHFGTCLQKDGVLFVLLDGLWLMDLILVFLSRKWGFNWRWDIENGVNPQYYADFVNAMRSYTWYYGSKYYYISAAPQYNPSPGITLTNFRCPYPDASLGDALDSTDFEYIPVI